VFVAKPCNALLLDEPTNHLDVDTVDVLAAAVAAFEGAVLLVTHDRYLVESVATHVLRLGEPGVMVLEEGVRPQHFDLLSTATTGRPAEEASGEGGASYADRKQAARALQRDRRRLNKVEREIAKLEERTSALDDALVEAATDFDRVKALAEEQREAAESLEALYAEWETLATKLE
jgi:ATP-binding cassette subfamily F protein 3